MRYLLTNSLSKLRGKSTLHNRMDLIFLSVFQNLVTNIHTDKTHKHTLLLGCFKSLCFTQNDKVLNVKDSQGAKYQ